LSLKWLNDPLFSLFLSSLPTCRASRASKNSNWHGIKWYLCIFLVDLTNLADFENTYYLTLFFDIVFLSCVLTLFFMLFVDIVDIIF
jgi:hypothetical protein